MSAIVTFARFNAACVASRSRATSAASSEVRTLDFDNFREDFRNSHGLVRKPVLVRLEHGRLTGSKQQFHFDGDQFRQEVRPITRFRTIVILLQRGSVIMSPLGLKLSTQRIDAKTLLNRSTALLPHPSRTASLENYSPGLLSA